MVIVGANVDSRDIILKRRNGGKLQHVSETHRSHDAHQYPSEDGYHLNIKMVDPITGSFII